MIICCDCGQEIKPVYGLRHGLRYRQGGAKSLLCLLRKARPCKYARDWARCSLPRGGKRPHWGVAQLCCNQLARFPPFQGFRFTGGATQHRVANGKMYGLSAPTVRPGGAGIVGTIS